MAWVADLLVVGLIEGDAVEGVARNGFPLGVLGGLDLPRDPRPGVGTGAHEAGRLVAGLDDMAVVREAVERRRSHLRVAEHGGPLLAAPSPSRHARMKSVKRLYPPS